MFMHHSFVDGSTPPALGYFTPRVCFRVPDLTQPSAPHEHVRRVRKYFAAQAASYHGASGRGLWAYLRRLETPAVMDLAQVEKGEAILDAGSGAGHYTQALHDAGAAVTALDIEPAMIAALKQRLHVATIEGDLMTVRLEPVYDKIVCAGVLEFVADPAAVLTNLAHGLRPSGPQAIVILVVAKSMTGLGYWLTRRTNGINMPLFSRAGLDHLAAASGLKVDRCLRAGYNWVARMTPNQPVSCKTVRATA
jgi:SAM-dependent methyltransferase